MAIAKITAAQFETQISDAIEDRDEELDTTFGPIRDTVIAPVAQVLETQNDRIRRLSLILSLINFGEFTEQELDEYAWNEEMLRLAGVRASGTEIFQRRTIPTSDLTVPINFPVATVVDPVLGRQIQFRTTETKVLPVATADLFFNASTRFYELEVSLVAVVAGFTGIVGTGRITQPLRSLPGFDQITNRAATAFGKDREDNEDLGTRLIVAIPGTDVSTNFGIEREVVDKFQDVTDVTTVFGLDPLLDRADDNAGAIDAYIIGSTSTTASAEAQDFLGVGQPVVLDNQPVISVAAVDSGGPAYVQGTDYAFVPDTGPNAGSVRAQDAIVFLTGGSAPSAGDSLSITYNHNALPQSLQDFFIVPDKLVHGRDLLFKVGTERSIEVEADLSVLAGTDSASIQASVLSAIVTYINGLGLGDDVEESDVNAEVRKIAGVDNVVFQVFRVIGSGAAVADIAIAKTDYARIESTDVAITIV